MINQVTELVKVSVELAKIIPSTKIFSTAVDYKLAGHTGKRIANVFQSNSTGFSRWANIGCATCSTLALGFKTAGSLTECTSLKMMTYPLTVAAQACAIAADSFEGKLSIKSLI